MPNIAVLGTQWGDEGKGKIVDFLAEKADIVARFQGGANAGHTVVFGKEQFILHLLPSGALHPGKVCVIGNGVVVDLEQLFREVEELKVRGYDLTGRLFISGRANLVLPYHKMIDRLSDSGKGDEALGTTFRGIGPAYVDKVNRLGVRVSDIFEREALEARLNLTLVFKEDFADRSEDKKAFDRDYLLNSLLSYGDRLAPLVCDTSFLLLEAIEQDKNILFEGAQGALLDVDFGTYPYTTSSNTSVGGIFTGLGIPPAALHETIGIAKAYNTRVGNGPFPTEETGETGDRLRERGNEFGATTQRPRRCGWLDLVALKYTARINGVNKLALTKLDVLDEFAEIKVCTSYRINGAEMKNFPDELRHWESCEPIYQTLPGWQSPTSGLTSWGKLPQNARDYISFIEKFVGVPVNLVSTGVSRREIVRRS
ncbi:MAG: adenylosuccinate synthetase [candidate division Zixibacteria bacterium DG_27]|nr:MAG: adenylosuccinate synthetase [candidate division Zixibacteria bacterium DG_27]